MQNHIIVNANDPRFQAAFQTYFGELGISVKDWDGLFHQMEEDAGTVNLLVFSDQGRVLGFIQLKIDTLQNWFFEETVGFVREFWIAGNYRNQGCGTKLLQAAENYFQERGAYKAILTTDTAPDFYRKNGYVRDHSYQARNEDAVFTKLLK